MKEAMKLGPFLGWKWVPFGAYFGYLFWLGLWLILGFGTLSLASDKPRQQALSPGVGSA